MTSETDMALAALLGVAREADALISEDTIKLAYDIQKRHQFDREEYREASMQEMQRMLEDLVQAPKAVAP